MLCIEALDKEFAQAFWEYVEAGGYENRQKSTGKRLFYRFYAPKISEFPEMLELFSRVPDALQIVADAGLIPIPVEDEVSSLSAILLNDDYYRMIHERKREVDGLTMIGPIAITGCPIACRGLELGAPAGRFFILQSGPRLEKSRSFVGSQPPNPVFMRFEQGFPSLKGGVDSRRPHQPSIRISPEVSTVNERRIITDVHKHSLDLKTEGDARAFWEIRPGFYCCL